MSKIIVTNDAVQLALATHAGQFLIDNIETVFDLSVSVQHPLGNFQFEDYLLQIGADGLTLMGVRQVAEAERRYEGCHYCDGGMIIMDDTLIGCTHCAKW